MDKAPKVSRWFQGPAIHAAVSIFISVGMLAALSARFIFHHQEAVRPPGFADCNCCLEHSTLHRTHSRNSEA